MSLVVPIFFIENRRVRKRQHLHNEDAKKTTKTRHKTEKLNGQYSNTRELYHIDDDKESRNWISSQE